MNLGNLGREYRLAIVLGAFCVLLAIGVVVEWIAIEAQHDAVRKALGKAGEASLEMPEFKAGDFELADAETFSELLQRPLFQESRRPMAAAAPTQEAAPEKPKTPMDLKLMGVVLSPQGMVALIQDNAGKYTRAPVDTEINNWTLKKILPDRVVLEQQGETQEVPLLKPRPKAPAQPGAGQPQQPRARITASGAQPGQPPRNPRARVQPSEEEIEEEPLEEEIDPDLELENEESVDEEQ